MMERRWNLDYGGDGIWIVGEIEVRSRQP